MSFSFKTGQAVPVTEKSNAVSCVRTQTHRVQNNNSKSWKNILLLKRKKNVNSRNLPIMHINMNKSGSLLVSSIFSKHVRLTEKEEKNHQHLKCKSLNSCQFIRYNNLIKLDGLIAGNFHQGKVKLSTCECRQKYIR